MDATAPATVYWIYAWIRGIHPMLWRRFLVRSDRVLADVHWVLQIGSDGPLFTSIDFEFGRRAKPFRACG